MQQMNKIVGLMIVAGTIMACAKTEQTTVVRTDKSISEQVPTETAVSATPRNQTRQPGDPPFGRDMVLTYQGKTLTVGYTTIDEADRLLGKPDNTEFSKYGGEEFYWEDLVMNQYYGGKLTLVFSKQNNRLVQLIFRPQTGDTYSTTFGINQSYDNSKAHNLIVTEKKLKNYGIRGIIISIAEGTKPRWDASFSLSFTNNGQIKNLNLTIDAPWWKE